MPKYYDFLGLPLVWLAGVISFLLSSYSLSGNFVNLNDLPATLIWAAIGGALAITIFYLPILVITQKFTHEKSSPLIYVFISVASSIIPTYLAELLFGGTASNMPTTEFLMILSYFGTVGAAFSLWLFYRDRKRSVHPYKASP